MNECLRRQAAVSAWEVGPLVCYPWRFQPKRTCPLFFDTTASFGTRPLIEQSIFSFRNDAATNTTE